MMPLHYMRSDAIFFHINLCQKTVTQHTKTVGGGAALFVGERFPGRAPTSTLAALSCRISSKDRTGDPQRVRLTS